MISEGFSFSVYGHGTDQWSAVSKVWWCCWSVKCSVSQKMAMPLISEVFCFTGVARLLISEVSVSQGMAMPLVNEVFSWWAPESEKVTMVSFVFTGKPKRTHTHTRTHAHTHTHTHTHTHARARAHKQTLIYVRVSERARLRVYSSIGLGFTPVGQSGGCYRWCWIQNAKYRRDCTNLSWFKKKQKFCLLGTFSRFSIFFCLASVLTKLFHTKMIKKPYQTCQENRETGKL